MTCVKFSHICAWYTTNLDGHTISAGASAERDNGNMKPLIRLEDVQKTYPTSAGTVYALRRITLTVGKGEFLAVVGQSGSGKSTLMNILGCLDTPTSGRYWLEDREVSRLSDDEQSSIRGRTIGFVFQGFHLIPSLDALENVELPLLYRGMGREERRRLARESLEQVGLGRRLHHRPGEMSGGQQQRVAIARAIAAKPPVILADEPTGNLDSRSGHEVMDLLHALHRDGRTVVLITHDAAIASEADRQICIHDGELLKI